MNNEILKGIGGNLSKLMEDNSQDYAVQEMDLSLIDEDPNQPRKEDNPGFQQDSLEELAATIRERGVKSPISVRKHTTEDGRYIINHGARRYRASKLAGKITIPAYIDEDYTERDQVIENIQRNELTAMEIAAFIGKELKAGKKKTKIAEELGRPNAFVTQHATLLNLPPEIEKAYAEGKISDLTAVNELVKAHKTDSEAVSQFLQDRKEEISRADVKMFREFLDGDTPKKDNGKNADVEHADYSEDEDDKSNKPKKEEDPEKLKKAIVQVEHDERQARLLTNKRPTMHGFGWIKYDADGHEVEVDLKEVVLLAVWEG